MLLRVGFSSYILEYVEAKVLGQISGCKTFSKFLLYFRFVMILEIGLF